MRRERNERLTFDFGFGVRKVVTPEDFEPATQYLVPIDNRQFLVSLGSWVEEREERGGEEKRVELTGLFLIWFSTDERREDWSGDCVCLFDLPRKLGERYVAFILGREKKRSLTSIRSFRFISLRVRPSPSSSSGRPASSSSGRRSSLKAWWSSL